jgi:hypothetical protein
MPKRNKGGTKRKGNPVVPGVPKPNGHSIVIRSAEALGRVIGALQRQLDEVAAKAGRPNAPKTRVPSSRKPAGMGNPRHTRGKGASGVKKR